jgi:acetylornithine deacetylase/succinyl-diaminopimelate desuccinylase-like protein
MFKEIGLTNVRIDREGNVLGEKRGAQSGSAAAAGGGPHLVFSAHLDTVFPEGTNVTVKREGAVPFEAWAEVDMRSADPAALKALDTRFHKAVDEAVAAENARWGSKQLTVTKDLVGDRPAGGTPAESPIVVAAVSATKALGLMTTLDEPRVSRASVSERVLECAEAGELGGTLSSHAAIAIEHPHHQGEMRYGERRQLDREWAGKDHGEVVDERREQQDR